MLEALPIAFQAALWGGVAGCALIIGALVGYFINLPHRVVSAIMAFGSGVLISALSFDLMQEAVDIGGLNASLTGFLIGVLIYTLANGILDFYGAKHRKRSNKKSVALKSGGAATAIALGALLDGIPEASAIGVSLLDGEGVALVTVFAIFMSNIPEGLSSSAGMKKEGRKASYVFGLWISIALISALAAWVGYSFIGGLDEVYIAGATAVAAGAILVMIVQTMIPEAVEDIHSFTGPIAASGFLVAFAASQYFG